MNYKVLNGVFLLIGCALSSESYARCTAEAGFKSFDINMNIGRIVVRPSDPVGKILHRASFPVIPNNSLLNCDSNGGVLQGVLSKNTAINPAGGIYVYNTNIKGIGIRLYRMMDGSPNVSGYYPYSKNLQGGKRYFMNQGTLVVDIVKTANLTGSGALTPGRYSSYHSRDDVSHPYFTSSVYGNGITIASSTCQILGGSNKTVQLPSVDKAGFKGVGSTQGTQAFDLNLLCNGGENPTAYVESNKIHLNFEYTSATNTTNVLANNAPASTRAKGVGIQLKTNYNNKSKIIAKNEKLELGTVKSNQRVQYNVPLSASYYQTDAVVTPGKVSSVATVNIQYD